MGTDDMRGMTMGATPDTGMRVAMAEMVGAIAAAMEVAEMVEQPLMAEGICAKGCSAQRRTWHVARSDKPDKPAPLARRLGLASCPEGGLVPVLRQEEQPIAGCDRVRGAGFNGSDAALRHAPGG